MRTVEIIGFPNYTISESGEVFSKKRNKILAQHESRGYMRIIILRKDNKSFGTSVHRLLGLHFIHNPNPKEYIEINHKNGLRNDNRLDNLEWCSHAMNMRHSIDVLKRKKSGFDRTTKKVTQLLVCGKEVGVYYSIPQASRATNIPASSIMKGLRAEGRVVRGYIWKCEPALNNGQTYKRSKQEKKARKESIKR